MSVKEKIYICDATGNTYPIKDQLKALGFRWLDDRRIWQAMSVTEKDRTILKTKKYAGVKFTFHSPTTEETPF